MSNFNPITVKFKYGYTFVQTFSTNIKMNKERKFN